MRIAAIRAGALVAACALSLVPAGARAEDIRSVDIVPADGRTGQSLSVGSGVKTGHLQDGAVTDAKIAAVSGSKIVGTIPAARIEGGAFMKKYSHVVVVAKAGGDFTDPVAALLAIGDASESNRYLVKIMPGVYDVGASPLPMKSWVDVEGSGEGVTVVRGTGGGGVQYRTVVLGADRSELRLLTVEAVGSPDPAGIEGMIIAVGNYVPELGTLGHSNLSHVTLIAGGNGVSDAFGVVYTVRGDVTLSDVTVRISGFAKGGTGVSAAAEPSFAANPPRVELRGLDVAIAGGQWSEGLNVGGAAIVELRDSSVRVSGATGLNIGIFAPNGQQVRVTNVISETQGAAGQALYAYSDGSPTPTTYVERSTLRSTGGAYAGLRNTGGGRVFAAYTQVEGPVLAQSPTTCVGLYSGTFQPVTCP